MFFFLNLNQFFVSQSIKLDFSKFFQTTNRQEPNILFDADQMVLNLVKYSTMCINQAVCPNRANETKDRQIEICSSSIEFSSHQKNQHSDSKQHRLPNPTCLFWKNTIQMPNRPKTGATFHQKHPIRTTSTVRMCRVQNKDEIWKNL